MRKRGRKKQGVGEFAKHAFGVSYVLDDVSSQRANEFLDRFVEQVITPTGLECHEEHRGPQWDFRVAGIGGVKPTKAQRAAIVKWLKSRKELARFEVEEIA